MSRIASEGNRTVFTKIAESIYSDYGGKEHCPWSVAQLRGKFFFFRNSASKTIDLKVSMQFYLQLTILL